MRPSSTPNKLMAMTCQAQTRKSAKREKKRKEVQKTHKTHFICYFWNCRFKRCVHAVMARQEGVILLTGPVGNLSFYKSKGEYFVRRKSGVSAERINLEPAYARTRENIAEFRKATLAARLLRNTFQPLFDFTTDNCVSSRLTGSMVKVIQGDSKNPRGRRSVNTGNLSLLERFEINRHGKLTSSFQAPFAIAIDRAGGTMVIDIPSFIPVAMLFAPRGATHYRLKAGAAAIDFERNTAALTMTASADLPISEVMQDPIQLKESLPLGPAHPLFVVLAIEFLQEVNGECYTLANRENTAAAIIKVDGRAQTESLHEQRSVKVNRFSPRSARTIRPTHKSTPSVSGIRYSVRKQAPFPQHGLPYANICEGVILEKLDSS